jgi:mRNA degradation ribonuclease J1/J2
MPTKEQKREYNQAYYAKYKDRLKQDSIDYYHDNKEKVLATVHAYRDENREVIKEKGREYYRRNLKNRLINAARARSKKSGVEFDLTADDFEIPDRCPLLDIELYVADGRKTVKYNSASLDRIDSSKGYTKDNIWIISFKANTMKSNSTLDEFLLMAENWKRLKGQT